MKCPRCDQEMATQLKGQGADAFEVDTCAACNGIWLDAEELNKMDDNLFVSVEEISYSPAAADESDNTLVCPRCDKPMDKVHPEQFSDVVVDNCPECKGFWLDAGELDKMKDISDQLLIQSLTE
ncbi:MAG: zf-TFIIB domain-containing protein [Deltaproteobacteria bacterium]|nr:zf-TFIIB domain-containing protein [Deltaproteobacteria bacterium]MBN2673574.1 zf-TFIIB domain-containing protein [Deltaproteobacteria bacterium]